MADGVELNAGSGGVTMATDDAGAAGHVQIVKLAIATDGSATPIDADADGLKVKAAALPLPSGAATAANQATGNTSLASIDGKMTAVNTGAVVVASSALPSGAATEAKQDTEIASLSTIAGDTTSIDDKTPALGQAAMAASVPVAIASDQSAVPVSAAGLPLPSGASTSAKQDTMIGHLDGVETALAGLALESGGNLAAAATSLAAIDDWDETGRAKVNLIVGQAGIAAGTGTDGATVPRVTLATNVPLPAGTNAIGKLAANSGVDIGDVDVLTLPTRSVVATVGTQIRFFLTASFSPADQGTNWTSGTPTDVALTLNNLGNGAGRQSAKVDLGANRAKYYDVFGCVDYSGETPSATGQTDYYWAPSTSATAGNGNVAGNSGGDAAAPDGALGSITLAEFLKQCQFIGSLFTHDGASVQNGYVGRFSPVSRYGQLVVVNNGGDTYEQDDVEAHQVMTPVAEMLV